MKAFLISGIGADARMFSLLKLPDIYDIEFLDWPVPRPDETLAVYACRMIEHKDLSEPFILIGISFGGILAVEIAKKYVPTATIIISSIPLSAHMPAFYSLAGRIRMNEFIPVSIFKYLTFLKQRVLMKSESNKKLIGHVIMDCNESIIRWGLKAALNWRNTCIPDDLYHIHGRSDSVFPIKKTSPTHLLDGGHMLILSEPEKVNRIIRQILQNDEAAF